jgi:hypothetical protein
MQGDFQNKKDRYIEWSADMQNSQNTFLRDTNEHSVGGNEHSVGGNEHSIGGNEHSVGGVPTQLSPHVPYWLLKRFVPEGFSDHFSSGLTVNDTAQFTV